MYVHFKNGDYQQFGTDTISYLSFDAGITDADRKRCYIDNVEQKTITFIFDSLLWRKGNPKKIEVMGSFNNWKSAEGFTLQKSDTAKVKPYWYVTLPYSAIKFPGNSGQPEFKFVLNGGTWLNPPSWLTSGYKFVGTSTNQIIVFSTDDIEEIKAKSELASKKKTLSEFDLTTQQGREDISNVRVVPATTQLIRCYHPFKYTTSDRNSTEWTRVEQVNLFLEEYGIKTDICLSENDVNNLKSVTISGVTKKETIQPYYQGIIDAGRVLYVGGNGGTNYYDCYHDPRSEKVGGWVKQIIDYIASDESLAPYSIHCRIGTDRTGFFCAIIAAICGADYSSIVADYQRSNNMCIKEYRDAKMMQVAFEGLLEVDDISQITDLQKAVTNYFIEAGYTTQEKVVKMIQKLNTTPAE